MEVKKGRLSYADRVQEFVDQHAPFEHYVVEKISVVPGKKYPMRCSLIGVKFAKEEGGRPRCDCCGSQRVCFFRMIRGRDGEVFLIGIECEEQLLEKGVLNGWHKEEIIVQATGEEYYHDEMRRLEGELKETTRIKGGKWQREKSRNI